MNIVIKGVDFFCRMLEIHTYLEGSNFTLYTPDEDLNEYSCYIYLSDKPEICICCYEKYDYEIRECDEVYSTLSGTKEVIDVVRWIKDTVYGQI